MYIVMTNRSAMTIIYVNIMSVVPVAVIVELIVARHGNEPSCTGT